jgi:hypothetical protein
MVIGTISVAAVVGGVALLGASYAFSAYQNNRLKKSLAAQQQSIDNGRTVMSRDPIAPRRLIYGQVLVSGTLVFVTTTGIKNEYLHLVLVLAGHECEEIGSIYFDGTEIPLDGSGNATGTYAGAVRIKKHLGSTSQTADSDLVAEAPTEWTTDHRGRGVAYIYARLKYDTSLFPNGMPTITALVKGKKVLDQRSSTTAWSPNWALCVGDFLNDPTWGKGIAYARIPSADQNEAANISDEDMVLADSSLEKRYTINGVVTSDQDPNSVLLDLVAAGAGTVVDTGGIWTIRAGAYRSPSVTFTDSDLLGAISVQPRLSRQDTFNGVRGVYISPTNQWAAADFPVIKNDTYKAQDGGIRLWRDITLPFTTSAATAQRLAKIMLERGRQQITVSALFGLAAMSVMPADVCAMTRAALGWSAKEYEVAEWGFQTYGPDNGPLLGIQQTLRETASGVWDWANGEETTVDLAANTNLPNPSLVATPTGLSLLADDSTAFPQADGTFVPRLRVTWNLPDDIYVTQGGKVHIEYKKHADSDWLVWNEQRGDQTIDYITDVLAGVAYDVRINFVNNIGVVGAVEEVDNYTIDLKTGAPSAPTGGALTTDGVTPKYLPGTKVLVFGTRVFWDKPSDPDYGYTQIKATFTNSDGATDDTWVTLAGPGITNEKTITLYNAFLNPGYVRIRHVNRTGTPSAWVALGNANGTATIGLGSISAQNTDSVETTGLAMGSGGSVQSVMARFPFNSVVTTAGGAPTEKINFDISGRGFAAKPDGMLSPTSTSNDPNVGFRYDWDDAGNSSTNAVIELFTIDGSNLPGSASFRITPEFWENN